MEITKKTRFQLILQNWIFIVLFLAAMILLGWLSAIYTKQFDWTATGRNSLTPASVAVLKKLKDPLYITSYASSEKTAPVRTQVRELIKRYQKYSDKVHLKFVNILQHPDEIRRLNIQINGELIVKYQGRSEQVTKFNNEESLTNAIQRLLRNADRKVVFITGHGERNPQGRANADLGEFFHIVSGKGFKVSTLDLTQSLSIPSDTSLLVIASPQLDYLPGEITAIKNYLAQGGNLWWMQEPDSKAHLQQLADALHVDFMKGTIVSAVSVLGANDPTDIIAKYLPQKITHNFEVKTIYPDVAGIKYTQQGSWKVTPFLESYPDVVAQGRTIPGSWLKVAQAGDDLNYVKGKDVKGPIKFGIAMTRTVDPDKSKNDKSKKATYKPAKLKDKAQRVVVMGDGDFISNTFLGNLGNLTMGENILNWLTHDDNFINIPPAKAPDAHLGLSKNTMGLLGIFYYLVITSILIGAGIFVWLRRSKR